MKTTEATTTTGFRTSEAEPRAVTATQKGGAL